MRLVETNLLLLVVVVLAIIFFLFFLKPGLQSVMKQAQERISVERPVRN